MHNGFKQLEKHNNIYLYSPKENSNFFKYAFTTTFKSLYTLMTKKVDVIFSGSLLTIPITVTLGKIFRKKVLTNAYGLDIIYENKFYQFLIKRFLPKVDIIITISGASKKELLKRGAPENNITLIHPGVDFSQFQINKDIPELKNKYRLENKKIILTVGRFAQRKGIPEFISNCLPKIIKEVKDVIYIPIGAGIANSLTQQDSYNKILKAIKENKMENNVKILEDADKDTLIDYYNICEVFVLSVIPIENDMEGFGMVFIEANAAGKPVVGTRVGGIVDAVEENKSGILVDPYDWDGLSKEIISILKDNKKANSLGLYGKKRVKEEFDWPIIGKKYNLLLENVLNKN